MSIRSVHLAMAAFAVVSAGEASAQDMGQLASPPEITAKSQVYHRADFDLTVDRDFYPQRALNDEIEGLSVVLCQVGADGDFEQCVVESETPGAYGFGKAHALMLLMHGHVDIAKNPPGTWIRNHFKWTIH